MFDGLFNGLAWLLNFFYELVPDYAFAIGGLTVVVYLATFPLTAKSMRSMAAMSKLAPEIRQLQQQHKDDRQKQSEEMMALYKAHKVSPLGGCIPLLIQWPIFIVMFRVLSGLTAKGSEGTFLPKYLDHGSKLYDALVGQTHMKSLGIDLAKNATEAAKASFTTALPFFLLIGAVVATGYWQQAMISRRNPQSPADDDNPVARQMRMMTRVMPLMYLIFGFTLPAGLNVYFLISALVRIGQQTLIYRLDPTLLPGRGLPERTDAASKPVAKEAPKQQAKPSTTNGSGNGRVTPPARSGGGSNRKKKKRR